VRGGLSMAGSAQIFAAYDALLARWPAGTEEIDVATAYGGTRVHAHGPAGAPPLVPAAVDRRPDGLPGRRPRRPGALPTPHRVDRLVLLDPTQCFAGFRSGFLLCSLPVLLRPTHGRALAYPDRETDDRVLAFLTAG
jgi:hypothetical protein